MKPIIYLMVILGLFVQGVCAEENRAQTTEQQVGEDDTSKDWMIDFENLWDGLELWDLEDKADEGPPPTHASLTLPGWGWGLSFGNSESNNGIRFNLVDDEVRQ
ncbi:MAG: hypothetical protein KJ645_07065, partial [Planctomycetes bacterium]|nr:hypothetical protein [Planctomycetota bacterium]